MAGELSYKRVKLCFNKNGGKIEGPDGFVAKADLDTIKGVLTAVVPAIGIANCLKLGTAATALTIAGLAIPKIWNWARAKGVKEGNILELEISKDKEQEFREKIEDEVLLKQLQSKFKRLKLPQLEEMIGKDVKEEIGEKVLAALQGVGIESVEAASETWSTTSVMHHEGGSHELQADDSFFNAKFSEKPGTTAIIVSNKGANTKTTANRSVFMVGNMTKDEQEMAERIAKDKKQGSKANEDSQ